MKTYIIPTVLILFGGCIMCDGIVRTPQLIAVGFAVIVVGFIVLTKKLRKWKPI